VVFPATADQAGPKDQRNIRRLAQAVSIAGWLADEPVVPMALPDSGL